jgi:hypothetical protein
MSALASSRPTATLRLPGGDTFVRDPEAPVLRLAAGSAEARALEKRLQRLAAGPFLVPTARTGEHGAELAFPVSPADAPLEAASLEHQDDPDAFRIGLTLAATLLECGAAAGEAREPIVLAPAFVRWVNGQGFRSFAVPAAATSLARWADAPPELLAWTAPEQLVSGGLASGTFAAGASLHAWFVGTVDPPLLGSGDWLTRRLRGRIGQPGRLRGAVAQALPPGFHQEADDLVRLVLELLAPRPGARAGLDAARARLAALSAALSPRRLAARLEHEGRADLARRVAGRWAEEDAELWGVLARLDAEAGRPADALGAALQGARAGDADARDLALRIARAAAAAPDGQATAMTAAEALRELVDDDDARLALADLEAHLGRSDAALRLLSQPGATPWREMRRCMVRARAHADLGAWPAVSGAVEAAALLLRDAPADGAGPLARAAEAYLLLLDGIAHFGAVAQLSEPEYLALALERFARSAELARALPDPAIAAAALHWIGWLRRFAGGGDGAFATVRLGVDAYLSALGADVADLDRRARAAPPLPWYDLEMIAPRFAGARITEEP